jgi:hypothetical protein
MIITATQLETAVQKLGFSFVGKTGSQNTIPVENGYGNNLIGISDKKRNNFRTYWFELDGGYLFFNHMYNANNGKTSRGWKLGNSFKERISKKLK